MIQEASLIEFTHWTFDELDDQPRERIERMLAVLSKRSALLRQKTGKGSGG